MRRRWMLLGTALAVLAPGVSRAADRLDHRGALGLELGLGVEQATVVATDLANNHGLRATLDLTPTFGLGSEGNELVATLRLLRGSDWGGALGFAYRGYFGRDEVKTFFQLGLKADTAPHLAAGPVAAFGLMYELSSLVGLYAQPELSVEVGSGFRVAYGGQVGLQARSYLLE